MFLSAQTEYIIVVLLCRMHIMKSIIGRAGTNTPSDEYDTYREYRVANTIRIANTLFLRGNKVMGKIWRRLTDCLESIPMSCLSLSFNYRK